MGLANADVNTLSPSPSTASISRLTLRIQLFVSRQTIGPRCELLELSVRQALGSYSTVRIQRTLRCMFIDAGRSERAHRESLRASRDRGKLGEYNEKGKGKGVRSVGPDRQRGKTSGRRRGRPDKVGHGRHNRSTTLSTARAEHTHTHTHRDQPTNRLEERGFSRSVIARRKDNAKEQMAAILSPWQRAARRVPPLLPHTTPRRRSRFDDQRYSYHDHYNIAKNIELRLKQERSYHQNQ